MPETVKKANDTMTLRHFITTQDYSRAEIDALLEQAAAFKRSPAGAQLAGKSVALLFFNPSMRTRTSFELAPSSLAAMPWCCRPARTRGRSSSRWAR